LSNQIVIFGQKTLQQTPSALDRVNVRRLMIYIKKRIGDIANTILFDQNLQATWNRFKARADKVLASVQSEFGLEEYKIVLDSSTTTPDLVDRNILYAKIFIKPARSIEFIAVDFVITRSGIEL
jgi:phage tail sheath protein FI